MSFTLIATLTFTFAALVWQHNDALNIVIKFGLVCLAFWGASIYFGV